MKFKPVKNEKIFMLVIDQIKNLIKSGDIAPGDKLPPERELASLLTVSRASVRQAISAMAAMGIVDIRHGSGTFIVLESDKETVLDMFSRLLADEQIAPNEIIETRKMVECFAARLCAERVTEGFVPYLQELIQRNIKATELKDVKTLRLINREFHMAIAEGTGNRGIVKVMREVFRMMKTNMWPRLKGITYELDEVLREHLANHIRIYEAIRDRKGREAEREMRNHLDVIEHELEMEMGAP